MKYIFAIFLFCITVSGAYSQCLNTDSLYVENITSLNALAKWSPPPVADHYIIHYRELGIVSWNNLANITGNDSARNIPGLDPITTYEWQIKTFCDTSNQPNSGWSYSDTFTTTPFVFAPFNPVIINSLSSLQCNTPTEFALQITQTTNEPDIENITITSDGGSFDINSINSGDSVGFAIVTTPTQSIYGVLKAVIINGQNNATIISYDSSGSPIGFFAIENVNGGVTVSSTTPNDNNNYTSGYISKIHFTNIFVNPSTAGPLHFFANIESELNDQVSDTDTVQIWCNSTDIEERGNLREIVGIYDVFGRKTKTTNQPLFYIYDDGTIEKKIIIE
jgi:hypothetical protein